MIENITLIGGLYLLATGLGFLLQPGFYQRMVQTQGETDPVTLNLSGASHFLVGVIVLVNVASFASVDAIAVMLLGLAAAMKGAFLIIQPERASKAPTTVASTVRATGIGFSLAGLVYLFLAFT